jgi:hypothetical protein
MAMVRDEDLGVEGGLNRDAGHTKFDYMVILEEFILLENRPEGT